MRDGFARGQEYSQAHPAYAAMQDVHIGDWDCDVCAETFTSVPFFACASFEDCVFKTCQGCLPVCARPDLAAAAPPTAVPVPAAAAAEPAPAPAPLDLSRVRECRVCRDPLKVYNAQHPMWTNLGEIPEWSCDVCSTSNWSRRKKCRKQNCNGTKPEEGGGGGEGNQSSQRRDGGRGRQRDGLHLARKAEVLHQAVGGDDDLRARGAHARPGVQG